MNAVEPSLRERIFWKYHYRQYLGFSRFGEDIKRVSPEIMVYYESKVRDQFSHPGDAAFQTLVDYADERRKQPHFEGEEEERLASDLSGFSGWLDHPCDCVCKMPLSWKEAADRAEAKFNRNRREILEADSALIAVEQERDWSTDFQTLVDNQPTDDAKRVWRALRTMEMPQVVSERGQVEVGLVAYWVRQFESFGIAARRGTGNGGGAEVCRSIQYQRDGEQWKDLWQEEKQKKLDRIVDALEESD